MYIRQLLFLHANGYPAAVYRRFVDALARSIEVIPLEMLQTPAGTPATLRWRRMRDKVVERLAALSGDPVTALAGHSMGGYLALMAAAHQLPARHPVVLIDSPIPGPGRAALLSLAQGTGLVHRFGPAPVAARRRHSWPDLNEARSFFAGKTFVRRWAPGVLDDFLAHALSTPAGEQDGQITLRIPREEERDIYAHLPHREAARALQRLRGAGVSVGFVAGAQSVEMRMAGWPASRRLFRDRLVVLDAGHLVPLEAPRACADAVLELLRPGQGVPTRGTGPP